MPSELPENYPNILKRSVAPQDVADSPNLRQVPVGDVTTGGDQSPAAPTQADLQALVLQVLQQLIQSGQIKPQTELSPWKRLLSDLSQPRMVSLMITLGCELFTRLTHTVVLPETLQSLIDTATMLSAAIVAYRSPHNNLL